MSNNSKGPFMQAMEKYTKSIKAFISAQEFGHYSKPNGGIPKNDLEQSVQTSLGKADSALQSESDPTVPSWAKASSKPSYNSDEISDTNRAHKFATQEQLSQISTNQTNILSVQNKVGTNYVYDYEHGMATPTIMGGVTFTWLDNGKLSVKSNGTNTSDVYYNLEINVGSKYVGKTMSFVGGVASKCAFYISRSSGAAAISTSSADVTIPSDAVNKLFISVSANAGTLDIVVEPMIRDSNITSNAYSAPALPNYDLTRLESEDRVALIEEIDSGAKNLIDTPTVTVAGITFTADSDHYITASPNNSDPREYTYANCQWKTHLKKGNYVLAIDIKTATSGNSAVVALLNSSSTIAATINNNQLVNKTGIVYSEFTVTTEGDYGVIMKCYAMVARLMICTKAAFGVSQKFVPFGTDPFYQVPINHNMIYRGRNLGATLTNAQHTALSSGNFTDLYLGDYWTKTVTIPAGTYPDVDGKEFTIPAQTNITLKAVIADFDTFYAGYASSYAGINTHHAAVIVTGFSDVEWNSIYTTGGYVNSLIHKWLVGSALPQIETWFGSAKVLSHQKLLTNAITGDAASGWAWSSQKISLLTENQVYGSKVWSNSKAANGGYEPGEAFKHLNIFNHIDANLLFGNKNIWLRDIASAVWAADLYRSGFASFYVASDAWIAPAALILLS